MPFPQIQLDIFPSLFIDSVVIDYRKDDVYRNFGVCIQYLTVIKATLVSLFVSRGALHDKRKTAVRETKTTCDCSRYCHTFDLEIAAGNSLNFN